MIYFFIRLFLIGTFLAFSQDRDAEFSLPINISGGGRGYEIKIDTQEYMNCVLSSESADYIIERSGEITVPSQPGFIMQRKEVILDK